MIRDMHLGAWLKTSSAVRQARVITFDVRFYPIILPMVPLVNTGKYRERAII
jgi:hypothetical protein